MHEKIQACELRTYFEVFKVGGNGGFVIVCRVVAVIWFLRQRKAEERKKILPRGVTEGQKEVEGRGGTSSCPPPPLTVHSNSVSNMVRNEQARAFIFNPPE